MDPVVLGATIGGTMLIGGFIVFHAGEYYMKRRMLQRRKKLTHPPKPKPRFKLNMMPHLKNHN